MVFSKMGRLPAHILSLIVLIIIWEAAALFSGSRLLPGPGAVALRLVREITTGGLLFHLGVTLARVAASFAIAMTIGTALGIAMGRMPLLDRFLDGWLVLFLNVPALVTIILAYVWFGLTESAAIAAVAVNKIPNVIVTLREGARALDRDYL
jgi:NitT/TauT family transport system permease protein